MDNALKTEILRLVSDLAMGHYAEIAADGRAGRLSEEELRRAVEQYGRTLVMLPDEGCELVDEYLQSGVPNIISANVPLWTREEGRSDLTLSLTAIKKMDKYTVQIDDLHVL